MNLFQKIKILVKVNDAIKNIEETYKMDTTTVKPGWKTTEFWGKVALQVFAIYGTVSGFLPPDKAMAGMAILEGVYMIARVIVKAKGGSLPDIPGTTATATATVTPAA